MTPHSSTQPRVLLVVATLGRRREYLRQTLESIRDQEVDSDIVIVAPLGSEGIAQDAAEFNARLVADPGSLTAAINLGAGVGLTGHEYVNWLNDDDYLEPGSLANTVSALDADTDAVVAFGACRYVDAAGSELWVSRAGAWAPRILGWGPDLIPQPGMLMRAATWRELGGLDESYSLAFDLDLLLRARKFGTLINVGKIVSNFRWHADSLTVDDRSRNIAESERAKRAALSPAARKISRIWESPVRVATRIAVGVVNRRARKSVAL